MISSCGSSAGFASVRNILRCARDFGRALPHHRTVRLPARSAIVERWWREERKAFALASALGYGSRLPLETLRELRLILRLMRRKRMAAQFGAIATALYDDGIAMAAE
jgi:hypothetical protein